LIRQRLETTGGGGSAGVTDDTLAEVKACQHGPLFHFRVSKLGSRRLAELQTHIRETRSMKVYSERWHQACEQMELVIASAGGDSVNLQSFSSSGAVFAKVAEHLRFMMMAPQAAWKDVSDEPLRKYRSWLNETVLPSVRRASTHGSAARDSPRS